MDCAIGRVIPGTDNGAATLFPTVVNSPTPYLSEILHVKSGPKKITSCTRTAPTAIYKERKFPDE